MPPCGKDTLPSKADVENLEEVQYSRAISLEFLNPSHSSHLRKTSFNAATFNLVATIIGGGVLSLPLAFAKVGIVLATLMMIFAAYITEFGLYILCSCARRTGSNSYMTIVKSAFGPVAEIIVTFILSIYLLGVLVAFQVLLKDIFAPLARAFIVHFIPTSIYSPGKNFDAMVLAFIVLLISPLLVKRNLHSLRHFCYVGFFSVCVIVISITIKAYERNFLGMMDHHPTFSGKYYEAWDRPKILYFTNNWQDIFFAFPFVILAFLCAFNVVEVHGALENPTRTRVRSVLHTAIFTSLALFEIFGLVGYFYAYDECQGNIFLNFDASDKLIIVGRLGMGLTLMFGLPVSALPCKEAWLSIGPQIQKWLKERPLDSESETLLRFESGISTDTYSTFNASASRSDDDNIVIDIPELIHKEPEHNQVVNIVAAFFLQAFAYVAAISVPGIAIVWSVLGSSLSFLIGFAIPCACYLKIREKKGFFRTNNLIAFLLLIFSLAMTFFCTNQAINNIKSQK